MTEEERQAVLKWAGMLGEWLVEASGNGDERDSLEDLIAGKTSITVETIITIGLTNGKEIVLHNRCFESYMRNSYLGDTLFCEDGYICAEYMDYEAGDLWHRTRIVPTSVCYFDVKDIELNWPALYKQYRGNHDIQKEGVEDELPPAEDTLEKLKEDFSFLDKEVREKLSRLVKESKERGIDVSDVVPGSYKHLIGKIVKVNETIKDLYKDNPCPFRVFKTPILLNDGSTWPQELADDLILHQPNHNEKALGLLPDNQPETMAAKYWEVFGND